MTGVFPEPLATVREYTAPELAKADLQRLVKAGLNPSIASTYFERGIYTYNTFGRAPVQLRVPESQVSEASKILELAEEELPTNEVLMMVLFNRGILTGAIAPAMRPRPG